VEPFFSTFILLRPLDVSSLIAWQLRSSLGLGSLTDYRRLSGTLDNAYTYRQTNHIDMLLQ
jgi:hypothetical protein